MAKRETHFEQIPLEVVKGILEREITSKIPTSGSAGDRAKKAHPSAAAPRGARNGENMIPPFEIFHKENENEVVWRGWAKTLEEAKAKIEELGAKTPGEYIILSSKTGRRMLLQTGGGLAGKANSAAS